MATKHIVIYLTRENPTVRKGIRREGKEITGYQEKCILRCELRKKKTLT